MKHSIETLKNFLHILYDDVLPNSEDWELLLKKYTEKWTQKKVEKKDVFDESLNFIITYGDSLQKKGELPLKTLQTFLTENTEGLVKGVHVLPYFPYSSDDGFSISDYRNIQSNLGAWKDIEMLGEHFVLMSDLVLNHCSSKHKWFQDFLQNKEPFVDFFITGDKNADYSSVVRPRPHFILSEYNTTAGKKHVWTTFSYDQVDLNFAEPQVLFEMLDTMMDYIQNHKSQCIRLDAIAYLWKELGTPCLHHKKTHLVVKLIRAVLDSFAPQSVIVSETNVPHKENIQYFGDGDEAHMIYQFPLPPLLLHAFITENSSYFMKWVKTLDQAQKNKTYFNFCASHDGIGLTPTHGILPEEERHNLIETAKQRGARVSYKATPQGEIPYEINTNYFSALTNPSKSLSDRVKAFIASQSVMLSMPGVPGIYIHSLLGSQNWEEGVKQRGINRAINREKLDVSSFLQDLDNEETVRGKVFSDYLQLLAARKKSSAFHPFSPIKPYDFGEQCISFVRGGSENYEKVFCLVNISEEDLTIQCDATQPTAIFKWKEGCTDLITGDTMFFPYTENKTKVELILDAYQVLWLRENNL